MDAVDLASLGGDIYAFTTARDHCLSRFCSFESNSQSLELIVCGSQRGLNAFRRRCGSTGTYLEIPRLSLFSLIDLGVIQT